MTDLGLNWTTHDSDPGRDGWRHYIAATEHGDVHVMGSGRLGLWRWRLVRGHQVVGRGETHRGRGEPIRSVLAVCARQAHCAAKSDAHV